MAEITIERRKKPDGTYRIVHNRVKAYVPTKQLEYHLHIAIGDWLSMYGFEWLHVPNEGKRSPQMAAKLKRMGMRAGAPDILILGRYGMPCHMAIEVKSPTGKATVIQRAYLHRVHTCAGWDILITNRFDGACEFVRTVFKKQTGIDLPRI